MKKSKLLSLGTGLAVSLLAVTNAHANPFQAEALTMGYDNNGYEIQKTAGEDGKCGAGNCSDDKGKAKDKAKDKEGHCGGEKKDRDGKCGEGKCGADKKK